ncbi:MAG TPA: glycosyltransferase family 2 protein [Solirubrobacterales bacterium]|nr:glycosyltransferase family 2 protein [Solirubrobacterales bacterium]
MSVSVVIPTKDRPGKLGRCLASLRGQGAEIVVVDDGFREAELVADVAREHGAKVVRMDGRGPAAARNAGVAAASGEVVCFIDDDCEAEVGWVEALAGTVLSGEAECAAGRTVVAEDASQADRAWQAIADYLQRVAAEPGSSSPGFAATCNLACSRRLLAELPFDESFPDAAGEDRDWAAKAAARGSAPSFTPDAVVVHRPDLSACSFLRQQYRYGKGAARFRATDSSRSLGSPSFYLNLARAGFASGFIPGTLVLTAQLAIAAGTLVERQLTVRAAALRPARSNRHR